MRIERISIEKINPAKYNPRKDLQPGDPEYEKLKRSIQEFDIVEPLVWNERTGNLVGGHQRLKILQELGHTEAEVSVVDMDEIKEKALNVALNKISGDWDMDKLKDVIEDLSEQGFDLDLTGFDASELDDIMQSFKSEGEIVEDEPPDPPEEPVTKPGDLWLLGNHRLLCGDAKSLEDIERLLDGKLAEMVFTDPPYNVNYGEKVSMLNEYQKGHSNTDSIKNDHMEKDDFEEFLLESFKNMYIALSPGGAFYICHAESTGLEFRKTALEAGLFARQCIIWAKSSMVLGRQDYQWKHEPILYGWKPGAGHRWYGGRKNTTIIEDSTQVVVEKKKDHTLIHINLGLQSVSFKVPSYEVEYAGDDSGTTIWRVEKPLRNDVHPTMKPISLCAKAIQNSSKAGDIVLDQFGGSGSTLIAAEQTNRTCYMLEYDPKYVDVIIERWENLTGQKAVLENATS